ncbi:hypothetical protein MKY88_24470 [Lysinibacillus sp. FSL R7-0073]|uniref:Uncharacterized protein n=1 Tax=Lysinibacillus fusiformis TaxID=28031 RepID=A0A1E4QYF9_9BACI|nr:hypothetical protein [Lysinibacillus fusiformis]MBD8524015.1 hypothetical protein [Lysinibacillus fusiformis]MCR8854894.1 hypothetical protein [Lysinibacillus fusiformis]MED4888991.1 hypothetical protein [Lysinibacillus fusiformis]ODV53241.1 hypothetical protein BG258_23345 [Lysinibacillus fusiformis]WKT77123.1 hypothetical protein QYY55_24600 [Lysinibacillus fusiformis]
MSKRDNQVLVKQEYGDKFKPLLQRIKERVKNLTRGKEKGIVHAKTKASFILRDNGDINTVASKLAQSKLSKGGASTDVSTQSITVTNTKKITADEIIINNHKLNNMLYEYTDLKMVQNNEQKLVTGLSLETTVLTKSWEPDLGKYVMIRRPARFAMFSPELNVADVPKSLSINTDIEKEFNDMVDIEKAANKFNEFAEGGE